MVQVLSISKESMLKSIEQQIDEFLNCNLADLNTQNSKLFEANKRLKENVIEKTQLIMEMEKELSQKDLKILDLEKKMNLLSETLEKLRSVSGPREDKDINISSTHIVKQAKLLFMENDHEKLRKHLQEVIANWNEIEPHIKPDEFLRILWYSFFLDQQKLLIENSKMSSSSFEKPEAKIYTLYSGLLKNISTYEEDSKEIKRLKPLVQLFEQEEKEKLFKALDRRMVKLEKRFHQKTLSKTNLKSQAITKVKPASNRSGKYYERKFSFVTALPSDQTYIGSKELIEEWIRLAVFSDPFFKNINNYILAKVYSDKKTGKAYIQKSSVSYLKQQTGKLFVDIREFKPELKPKSASFIWPTTEVTGAKVEGGPPNFNQKSELRMLGYQISNSTRTKRWAVLEKAVPQLGLKKVVYTIAQFVKLRKGQKNGSKIFSYSIGEWEHDLARLKQTYYKGNFTWPNTH